MTRATQLVQEGAENLDEANMHVDEILKEIHDEHQESMPKATKAAYAGPMKEYKQWALQWAVEKAKKTPLDQVPEEERAAEEMSR